MFPTRTCFGFSVMHNPISVIAGESRCLALRSLESTAKPYSNAEVFVRCPEFGPALGHGSCKSMGIKAKTGHISTQADAALASGWSESGTAALSLPLPPRGLSV
jgi:hypothetical protein